MGWTKGVFFLSDQFLVLKTDLSKMSLMELEMIIMTENVIYS